MGETKPLNDVYPKKLESLKRRLHKWLEETHAVMPVQDPTYSAEKEAAYRSRSNARIMKSQENLRQNMMKTNWCPNATWWDSRVEE